MSDHERIRSTIHEVFGENPELPSFLVVFERTSPNPTKVEFFTKNLTLPTHSFSSPSRELTVLGHPILDGMVSREALWRTLSREPGREPFLRKIDGEFLFILLDKENSKLTVVNDRFASVPFFYLSLGNYFIGSVFYNDLWNLLRKLGRLQIRSQTFFEFLWLQRVLGTKTYDDLVLFLPSASRLDLECGKMQAAKYWRPNGDKITDSLEDAASKLAFLIKKSLKEKQSDIHGKVGLFLSGGLDSRTILAAFDMPPVCFTLSIHENNELLRARQAAAIRNAEHVFVKIKEDPYSEHLDQLIRLGGGFYSFDHALFWGLKSHIASSVDVAFHGHGIDYMFQGMYVPRDYLSLLNRRTEIPRIRRLSGDLARDFLNQIPYRLKNTSLLHYTKKNLRSQHYEALYSSAQEILDEGSEYFNNPYDIWEHFTTHSISRHYPYTNLLSMASAVEVRTPTFHNDIFSFYWSLPVNMRIDGQIAKRTLTKLNPKLARLETGNTNFPASASAYKKQFLQWKGSFLYKTGFAKKDMYAISARDRTWPGRDEVIRNHKGLRQAALDLCKSEALDSLGFLDMNAVAEDVHYFLENKNGGGAFMMFLITIDRFLRQHLIDRGPLA